ncbi:MAG: hypothetical protein JNL60_05410 [Bacteroidia bacterium]|nr:hypothetical protein [Bacteroidia bacterium]
MLRRVLLFICFFFFQNIVFCQKGAPQDSIFLMNGHVVVRKVIDTTFSTITILNPKKPTKRIHYESDQLYMVKFANGYKRYYYVQDPTIYNEFTRDEMWLFMKGEQDARKGFKARGAMVTAGIIGLGAGMTGSFFAPVLPYGFMAMSGLTKIRIRHNTISNMKYVESDAYILGYERVARQKRKTKSLIGGTIGLALGYSVYALFHSSYPEDLNFGWK